MTHARSERSYRSRVLRVAVTVAVACTLFTAVRPADAGCGCDKPPPQLASVRPNATYAGSQLALFSPSFQVGDVYNVDFSSGTCGAHATVKSTVVSRRDLADGAYKPQLYLTVPNLPLGPTSINVHLSNVTTLVLALDDSAFTVVPKPIAVPQDLGTGTYPNFTAAVGRDGTFYISLDMTAVGLPRVFRAQAQGYPLSFTNNDATFYNTQGFLMQLLTTNMPGLWSISSAKSSTDSDLLVYSRHEFDTYYLQHLERQPHQVVDDDWHLDGTRHVDHNHLVLAIAGGLANGSLPKPGATPKFTLVFERYSLFSQGLVAGASMSMSGSVTTDAYAPGSVTPQPYGDVITNGRLTMSGGTVNGNATGASFDLSGSAKVTGTKTMMKTPMAFMPIKIPDLLPDLGSITLNGGQRMTLTGPGSFRVRDLVLNGGSQLTIDNSGGPVTFYVTGQVALTGGSTLQVANPNPDTFAIYVASTQPVSLSGGGTAFTGVVYAPTSALSLSGGGEFFGSFVAAALDASGSTKIHFDTALRTPTDSN